MGPKFFRKPKDLRVFKNRMLTKSGAEKKITELLYIIKSSTLVYTSPVIMTLKELDLFICLLNKNDLCHAISVMLRFVSYASINVSVNLANVGFT